MPRRARLHSPRYFGRQRRQLHRLPMQRQRPRLQPRYQQQPVHQLAHMVSLLLNRRHNGPQRSRIPAGIRPPQRAGIALDNRQRRLQLVPQHRQKSGTHILRLPLPGRIPHIDHRIERRLLRRTNHRIQQRHLGTLPAAGTGGSRQLGNIVGSPRRRPRCPRTMMMMQHRTPTGAERPAFPIPPVQRHRAGQPRQLLPGPPQQPLHSRIHTDNAPRRIHRINAVRAALQNGLHPLLLLRQQMRQPRRLHRNGRLLRKRRQHRRIQPGEVGRIRGSQHKYQPHILVPGMQRHRHHRILHLPGAGKRQSRLRKQRRQQRVLLPAQSQIGNRLIKQRTNAPNLRPVQPVGAGNHKPPHRIVPGGNHRRAAPQRPHRIPQNARQLRLQSIPLIAEAGSRIIAVRSHNESSRQKQIGKAECTPDWSWAMYAGRNRPPNRRRPALLNSIECVNRMRQ